MKVLIDARLMSNKPTGISRYCFELIKSYNGRYGVDNVTVIACQAHQIPNKILITKLKPYNLIHFFLFPFLIWRQKADIYHSAFYSGAFFSKKQVTTIATVHDLMFLKVPRFFSNQGLINYCARLYYYIIVKLTLLNSQIIISVSNTTQKDVEEFFWKKSEVFAEGINNTVLATSGNNASIEHYNLDKKGFFLYVGNGRRHKNLNLLVSAFKKSTSNKKLVIIGNINLKFQGLNNVLQFDFLEDSVLTEFYSNCAAFIYPSVYEGFGLPILEAISNKAYVFCSNGGALKEFIFNSISFFPPDEESKLIELMDNIDNYCFDESDLERLTKYDWSYNFDKMHGFIYNSIKQ